MLHKRNDNLMFLEDYSFLSMLKSFDLYPNPYKQLTFKALRTNALASELKMSIKKSRVPL